MWFNRQAEAVFQIKIQTGGCEEAVKKFFQFDSVKIGQLVGFNNLNICEKVCRILFRVGDSSPDISSSHSDFVDYCTICGNEGMLGATPEHVDETRV